jgi:hypothetical protein
MEKAQREKPSGDGDEPAVLASAPPELRRAIPRRPPERHVLFLKPVRYTRRGHPILCSAWTARVPVPVADAAIKQGLALLADTDEAREKMRQMSEYRRRTQAGQERNTLAVKTDSSAAVSGTRGREVHGASSTASELAAK